MRGVAGGNITPGCQHTEMFKVLVSEGVTRLTGGHTSQPVQLAVDGRYNSYQEKFPQNGLQ